MFSSKALSFFLISFILCGNLYAGDPQVYFSPDKKNETRIVEIINHSKKTLDIAIYSLTLKSVPYALREARKRGVKIRMVMDKVQSFGANSQYKDLVGGGFEIRKSRGRGIMHSKYIVSDGCLVETGSFNYTDNAVNNNRENLLIIDSCKIGKKYSENFEEIWKAAAA